MASRGAILLADDEEVFLEATRDLLVDDGFLCSTARNAQELSTALQTIDFDLLITDLNMPGNRVLEMVNEIRSQALAIPVIIVTGYPSIPTAVESVRLNVLEYMIKPINHERLLEVTRQGVGHKQVLRSVRKVREEIMQRAEHLAKIENTLSVFGGDKWAGDTLGSVMEELETQHASLSVKTTGSERLPPELTSYLKLREGLYETIEVLQKTKGSFKSKVLADLRFKLMKLLKETSPQ